MEPPVNKSKITPDVEITETPAPTAHHAKARKRTIRRSAAPAARDALGLIEPGCEIFALTNGQFSMIDILEHILDATGPACVDLATWTAADGDLRRAHSFMLSGQIRELRMIVDPSFKTRKPEFCSTLTELFGDAAIRTIPLHGKFAAIRNSNWRIAIRTSMNLNPNKRIESVEISDDPDLEGFLRDFTDGVFAKSTEANFASQNLNQVAHNDAPSHLVF